MASQHAVTSLAAPASLIGNAFVIRYYNILHQTPHLGYRFYTEGSKISRAELQPETAVESATSLSAIHEKIMSLDYHATRTEIMTVDTQESLAGSVLVMVTGALYNPGGVKRIFVQTFLLVPQEKSYFIFNDMFKFLDSDVKSTQQPSPTVASNTPKLRDPNINPVLDEGVKETDVLAQADPVSISVEMTVVSDGHAHTSENSSLPRDHEQIAVEEDGYKLSLQMELSNVSGGTLPKDTLAENMIEGQDDVFASKSNEYEEIVEDENAQEAPKKSYATILRLQKGRSKPTGFVATATNTPPKVLSTYVDRSTSAATPQAISAAQLPSGGRMLPLNHTDELGASEAEGDGRSVYVKSLPLNVTVAELEEEFSKFGQLKPGGVNLRNQRIGVCYAFIEFEKASSAQCANQASPINMNGRQVYIEEKKVFPARNQSGRGRSNQGRGFDGMRGRGFFSTDPGRGRPMAGGRNAYGNGSIQVPNNAFRRVDSQNNSAFRPMRRGAGNQMGRNGPLARNRIMVAAA